MNLEDFVKKWVRNYQTEMRTIPLFSPEIDFSEEQKRLFAQYFWHARGHFSKTIWAISLRAPSIVQKKPILDNIEDEFGARSSEHVHHEILYNRFSSEVNCDTSKYLASEENYLPFLKEYNEKLNLYLLDEENSWGKVNSAFSAYELLDSIDYSFGLDLAKRWGLSERGLEFWEVHSKSNHYEEVSSELEEMYISNKIDVIQGFDFIFNHQLKMWRNLNKEILGQ